MKTEADRACQPACGLRGQRQGLFACALSFRGQCAAEILDRAISEDAGAQDRGAAADQPSAFLGRLFPPTAPARSEAAQKPLGEVRRIDGYPGDGIGGFDSALGRDDKIDFVPTRHGEAAAFMACAHAKYAGEVGVRLATSGPGAIHLLNGLYDAKLDHRPVMATVGQQARAALGGDYQQEVDLQTLSKDVAGDYVQSCGTPAQARHLIDRGMRIAASMKTVTTLIFPNDVPELEAEPKPPHEHGTTDPW